MILWGHYQLLNQSADFHEIQQGGLEIEGDLNDIFFILIASTIPK
jgi:hypothetical protein